MPVVLIARFEGNVDELKAAYDRAHELIGSQPGPPIGELRHHCAVDDTSLYLIGVWESEERLRSRWESKDFERTLTSVGFPSPHEAETKILRLHEIMPPL